MDDLNNLRYFVNVVDHMGITAAAQALALPRSTISYRLSQLEAKLGVCLIERTSRRFTVTDVGQEFYRHAQATLQHALDAESAVRQRLITPSGLLKISVPRAISHFATCYALPTFSKKYPDVKVVQRTSNADGPMVAEGFDVAIHAHALPLRDSSLIQRPLATMPWMLFGSPALFDERNTISHPDELKGIPTLFMILDGQACRWTLRARDGKVVTMPLSPTLMTDCLTMLKNAAIAGLGIVALPAFICKVELSAGSLIRVLPEWTAGDTNLTALMPYGQNQLPSVRALLDFLVEEVPGMLAVA